MRKLYFLLLSLCFFMTAHSQTITFGSAPFKDALLHAGTANTTAYDINDNPMVIDTNHNSEIEASEAANVYSLNLAYISPIIYNLSGLEYFVNLRWLDISASRVQGNLALMAPHLETLYCSNEGIFVTDINLSGLNLKILVANSNSAIIPYINGTSPYGNISQFTNLETFACGGNNLTALDLTGLNNLKSLNCNGGKLTSLDVSSHTTLESLLCYNNLLTSLNLTGCNSLNSLDAKTNKFTSLNIANLPALKSIILNSCALLTNLTLSNLPVIESLDVGNCALSSLPLANIPNLRSLYCIHNNIASIDFAGLTNLSSLECGYNQLTTLDLSMCTSPMNAYCGPNNLTSLFIKNGVTNGSVTGSHIDFNGNPSLQYICCDDSEFANIQYYITQYGVPNCTVNSYCSFVPGGTYYTVQGSHSFDNDDNGCDASDPHFGNLKFKIGTDGYSSSGPSGNYFIPLGAGTYVITPQLENPALFTVTPAVLNVTFPGTPSPVNQNFCVKRSGAVRPDVEVLLLTLTQARPGFDAYYKIIYRNKGNAVQSGTINLTFDDALLDLVQSSPAATQTVNNLSWSYTNLLPFESKEINFILNVNSPVETPPVTSGTLLAFNATISGDGTDYTPLDNSYIFNQHVVNSFDPNDKTCLEGATITPEMVGKDVHYMIRFENSGTANAENIVVKDIIDTTKFDIATLVPLDGSHPFTTKISNNKTVEFIFENINLPFDDAHNDGYVAFKIKTKFTLGEGASFSNVANIFFDYNAPIITNTATTTIVALANQDFVFENYISIHPNPANDVLNIDFKKEIAVTSFNIYNTLGQLVLVIPNAQQVKTIDVSNLKTGSYFLKVNSDKGSSNVKFVKQY